MPKLSASEACPCLARAHTSLLPVHCDCLAPLCPHSLSIKHVCPHALHTVTHSADTHTPVDHSVCHLHTDSQVPAFSHTPVPPPAQNTLLFSRLAPTPAHRPGQGERAHTSGGLERSPCRAKSQVDLGFPVPCFETVGRRYRVFVFCSRERDSRERD